MQLLEKCVCFVFIAVFIVYPAYCDEEFPPKELIEMLKPMHSYCLQDNGVTEDEVQNYVISNNEHKMMCYMACIMRQSNWLSNTGQIKYDFIINNPWEPIRDIIISNVHSCRDVEEHEDECVTVYNFARCLHDNDLEHWFLP